MKKTYNEYQKLPLPYNTILIGIYIDSNCSYNGCYAQHNDDVVISKCTQSPENDFLYISKFAIEWAENQMWDESVFKFINSNDKYVLIDDEIFGKLIKIKKQ